MKSLIGFVRFQFLQKLTIIRPSSYFFSEYYSMVQETGFTKDGKKRKNILTDIRAKSKHLGKKKIKIIEN